MSGKVNTLDILQRIGDGAYPPAWAPKLSERAVGATKTLRLETPEFASLPLRLYLDGKGCDGFYYGVTFDAAAEGDLRFRSQDIDIIVDPDTFLFVFGSTIDWIDDERGKGFLVTNPNHSKYRGKFYKKSAWQALLSSKQALEKASESSTPTP